MNLCKFLFLFIDVLILISCNQHQESVKIKAANVDTVFKLLPKPTSSFNDTLVINSKAAVFYHPDSLQLMKIKAQTDSMIYDGSMHEFFYQMRNAHIVIKKNWPNLKIVEAKNCRYLLFIKKDSTTKLIDLNTMKDAFGLFIFNSIKPPLVIDMMNIETEVSTYLK